MGRRGAMARDSLIPASVPRRSAPPGRSTSDREALLDLLLEATQDGILDWDMVRGVEAYNPRFLHLFGFDDESVADRPSDWRELVHPDDAARASRLLDDHLHGQWPFVGTFKMRHRHGGHRTILLRGAARRDAARRAVRMVIIFSDITEQVELTERLMQSEKLAAIGHLAAGVAHEINTPLQYIGDNLHFAEGAVGDLLAHGERVRSILDSATSPERSAAVAAEVQQSERERDIEYATEALPRALLRSLEGISRVTTIVRALKTFAHPNGHEVAPVDFASLVESTVAVARNEWKFVAEVEVMVESHLPPVRCAGGEIGQVLLNLLVNAAHAIGDRVGTSGEKGRIGVEARRVGDDCELRVRDTGTGIPEHARSKVFDPFFTTKEVGKGTGQGLALAHATIVNHHGGTIRFETELGVGTTFVVTIPLAGKPEPRDLAAE